MFIKENAIFPSKLHVVFVALLLDIEGGGGGGRQSQWYDFIVDMNHLFIRITYSKEKLTKMKNIKDICSYLECFELFIELISIIENAIENSQRMAKKKIEDL